MPVCAPSCQTDAGPELHHIKNGLMHTKICTQQTADGYFLPSGYFFHSHGDKFPNLWVQPRKQACPTRRVTGNTASITASVETSVEILPMTREGVGDEGDSERVFHKKTGGV
jgi:hypothetical protein